MLRMMTVAAVLVLCLSTQAAAQGGLAPGKITTVTCKHDSSQNYSCYLPTGYTPRKKWPILYIFGAHAEGTAFVKTFKNACEKAGWIVVGSNNAKNGPSEPIVAATKAIWKDTQARLSINDKRCYSTGFSGGSGMAFSMAKMYSDHFAGVIPMAVSTSWGGSGPDIPKHIAVYFIIGSRDMVRAVKTHAETLRQKGNEVEVNVFPGGHVVPPRDVLADAIEWLIKVAPKGGGSSDKPTRISFEKKVARRLGSAVRKARRCDLGGALRLAGKVLEDDRAREDEKADAKYIREKIEKRRDELFAEAEKLLEEKMPYEAKELLVRIRKAFSGTDEAKKAQDKIKEIDSDEGLKDELAAGKLFARALKYQARGKEKSAQKYFKQVVKKFPGTEYAKRAKTFIDDSGNGGGGTGGTPVSTTASPGELECFRLVNVERKKAGAPPLKWCDGLAACVRAHCKDQCARGFMGHKNPEGELANDRAKAGHAGSFTFDPIVPRLYGSALYENVSWGDESAKSAMYGIPGVVGGWMDSPGHRVNILNRAVTHIGVGRCTGCSKHWGQQFAAR